MNVAIINIKDTWKYLIRIFLSLLIIFTLVKYLSNSGQSLKQILITDINPKFLTECIQNSVPILSNMQNTEIKKLEIAKLMSLEVAILNPDIIETQVVENKQNINKQEATNEETTQQTASPTVEISKIAQTEEVSDRNFSSRIYRYLWNNKNR